MYDTNAQAISDKLTQTSTAVFNQETIDSILSLVTSTTDTVVTVETVEMTQNGVLNVAAGTEIAFVTTSDTVQTAVTVTGNTPVVMFQGAGGVDATFQNAPASASAGSSAAVADASATQRVIVGTAGADKITIADGKNTKVIVGDKDVVVAGDGHTVVVAAQGSSTVQGSDNTIVEVVGKESDFTVSVNDGHATIANAATGVSVDLSGVNFVQLDGSDALIFADNAKQAAVANMYHAVLGRNADAGGLDFWYDRVDEGVSLTAIANAFLTSAEYGDQSQTNAQFVDMLYDKLLGRDGDTTGYEFWTKALEAGVSRATVVTAFAEASVTDATEVAVVGTVTIVDGGTLA